jgi:hypothetical protein
MPNWKKIDPRDHRSRLRRRGGHTETSERLVRDATMGMEKILGSLDGTQVDAEEALKISVALGSAQIAATNGLAYEQHTANLIALNHCYWDLDNPVEVAQRDQIFGRLGVVHVPETTEEGGA